MNAFREQIQTLTCKAGLLPPGCDVVKVSDIGALASAPPSAPVGVEGRAREAVALALDERGHHTEADNVRNGIDLNEYREALSIARNALAKQPAAPSAPVGPYTYASTQATTCAGCGEHKHTPLRIDAMGGYVCLTCIDQKLGGLLGEFGYPPSAPVGVEAAEAMGATGGPASEPERLAFEAWMRGHCWALCATWDGAGYRSDAEQGGRYCPDAARTRMLWAAWRDRAALAQQPAAPSGEAVAQTLRDALDYVGYRTDGDLATLAERAELWMRESKVLIDMQAERLTALKQAAAPQQPAAVDEARPLDDWHEDDGPVVWWTFPVNEPAWIGSPTDSDWPGYHTHWTPHPAVPPALAAQQQGGRADG